jgi:hypothetical protein
LDVYDPHSSVNSSLTANLHFPFVPSVAMLWKRAESPLIQLLTTARQYERPAEKHLPDNRWSLPSGAAIIRYWQRSVQHVLEQRAHFGWNWDRQIQSLGDLLRYLPSRAELLAYRVMGLEASVASLNPPAPMELPEPSDSQITDGLSSLPRRRQVRANLSDGSIEHRIKIRAFDAPITRMDNIRRSRVLDRLLSSGRSIL